MGQVTKGSAAQVQMQRTGARSHHGPGPAGLESVQGDMMLINLLIYIRLSMALGSRILLCLSPLRFGWL